MEKNEEIRISPDALIAMVVAEAEARELASMPNIDELEREFKPSENFQRKMKKLLQVVRRKNAKKEILEHCKRGFVVIVSLISMLSCMLLPVKAVQKAVVETLIDWQEKFMAIIFSIDEDESTIRTPLYISSTYIPDGFSLIEPVDITGDRYYAQYADENGDWYTIRVIMIDNQQATALDNEFTAYYNIDFNSNRAIWGMMEDGSNVLLWEHGRKSFQVIGNLDLAELIQISENIKSK